MTEEEKAKLKILILDDDKFLLNMYSNKFKNAGFDIETIANTELALEKIRDGFKPDVLLLDIIMPKMSGLELVEKIKEEKLLPNATYVMLTNQSESADIDRAKKLKVHGYIVKATTIPSEVVEEVTKIIESRRK